MHPLTSSTAFGTCQVLCQSQNVDCFRQHESFCPAKRHVSFAWTPSNCPPWHFLERQTTPFSIFWSGSTSAPNLFTWHRSSFFGSLGIRDVNVQHSTFPMAGRSFCGPIVPNWHCTSKNVSRHDVGESQESFGYGIQHRHKESLISGNGVEERVVKKVRAVPEETQSSEVHGSLDAVAKSTKSLTSETDHANGTGSYDEKATRAPRDGFVSASTSNGPGESESKRPRTTARESFGRRLFFAESWREKRELLKNLRLGIDVPCVDELNDILSSLCRQRRSAEAHEVMDAVKFMPPAGRMKLMNNVKTFTIMIDICGKSRQLAKGFSLFYAMQRQGLVPNIVTYNAMVAGCSRNSEPDLAFEVFKEMEAAGLTPDKFTYGALIDSCAKCGKVDLAFEIADIMEQKNIQKDQTIYSALMDACGRANQVHRAFSVYEDMKKCGVWPNLITFSVLIDTCANAREPEMAFELFAEVRHWGFAHANVVVYTALIDACAKSGWLNEAQLVLESMIRDNVEPNEITYGALIDGWSRAGHVDESFRCLHEMLYEQGIGPNAVLLGGLTETCRRMRAYERAKDVWEVMVQYNVRISRIFYPALMAMAAHNGDVDVAIGIAFQVFGSGFLRRCTTRTDDPYFRALADSIIYLRSKINSAEDEETRNIRQARMRALYDATAMCEAEMDSVKPSRAFQRCISWGDFEQHRSSNPFKRRGDRQGPSKARQAREDGLRSLEQSRT